MWNRVFLLASGFAFGWILVSCLTAPLAQIKAHLTQLALSLVVGLAVIGFMALSSPQSGIAGGLVLTLSALVAYAGNARQIGKAEGLPPLGQVLIHPTVNEDQNLSIGQALIHPTVNEDQNLSIDRPERPLAQDPRIAVVLVLEGEPVEYDGPKPWARRFGELAASGVPVPHWLVRPFSYARIRAAYRAMGGRNPFNDSAARLAKQLEGQLGAGYCVQDAYLAAAPALVDVLVRLAEGGLARVALVPISFEGDPQEALRSEVVRSRVREVGAQVVYASPLGTMVWSTGPRAQRLRQLVRSIPLSPPPEPDPRALELLRDEVLASTSSWAMQPSCS